MEHGLYLRRELHLCRINKADNQGDAPAAFAGEVNYGLPIADRFNMNRTMATLRARGVIGCC